MGKGAAMPAGSRRQPGRQPALTITARPRGLYSKVNNVLLPESLGLIR
jgi:hypothetical protein